MKRRHRKPVLDINGESSDSSRRRWPNEQYGLNGSPVSNPLANLIGQYNSDDEGDQNSKPRSHQLNDQVNDFLKEIQSIAPKEQNNKIAPAHPGSFWQECVDEQTGFPYYWHTETNQVTWEIPPELKLYLETCQVETPVAHVAQIPPWSNLSSSNNFAQPQNIPEGMIPKEVVARNRNRQAGLPSTSTKSPVSTVNSKSPGYKDESFEDEKIEMITSFGNDESESDESEQESPQKVVPILKKTSVKNSKSSPVTNKNVPSSNNKSEIGPALPPVFPQKFGPQNQESLSEKLNQNTRDGKSSKNSINEMDILTRLKNQAKILQSKSKEESKPKPTKDIKLSLVPGYEDDSDGEDESVARRPTKPLFPITESASKTVESDKIARKIETNSGNIRIYEYRNSDTNHENSSPAEEKNKEPESEDPQEDLKNEQESKANKFLESLGESAKRFQRKPRIAFEVPRGRAKKEANDESTSASTVTSKEATEETSTTETETKTETKNDSEAPTKPAVSFVKATEDEKSNTDSNLSDSNNAKEEEKPKQINETEKAELRALTEPIMEKLKFLSEGSPAASAVQVMAIQIQTLLSAWESGVLQQTYLRNWLTGTGCELTRLEQTAAPPGWECQWDRTHKRYYYRNTTTNEAQWTYPQTDIAGGTEEMELCTTPPPPEHEDTPIIEMSRTTSATTVTATSTTAGDKSSPPPPPPPSISEPAVAPPPPPNISNPSPPPPPRINADDLQRGQKRKELHPDDAILESQDDLLKEGKGPEPMPPGVDPPPETAYALPVSALEAAGVLYGAQQTTNPIYAATLAGAGIPLISHHPHLMQGQIMHYTPTYHSHLHNQALVAARLQGQEAVQFMVAEYARMYENNQVIAKPPVKVTHDNSSLGTALNSFYSDIATIEKTAADNEKEKVSEIRPPEIAAMPLPIVPQVPVIENDATDGMKEKKKKKLKTGIGKKQKEMSSMVAKWQMAQKVYKEGH